MKVIPDTNALMAISQFRIDVFSELQELCDFKYSVAVLENTITELRKIIDEQAGKYRLQAKLALQILDEKEIPRIPGTGFADDLLVERAKKGDVILTQDKELKGRIKEAGGKVLTIRQKKRIVWG